ncbi:MAG TPA: TonB-dependent receptor [Terriglobales bacterium]|nr:TonB-dependent receptor [Terriglobales bacterium]
MRTSRLLLLLLLFSSLSARAAELKVEVTDPRGAAVAGARVTLYHSGGRDALAVARTSAEGVAALPAPAPGDYRVEVLAPGFAPQSVAVRVPTEAAVPVQLAVAGPAKTVVVTATATPISTEEAGAPVESLDAGQLQTLQPVALDEALRFLPGAVVGNAGQNGGLASLFVRGGESRYNKVIIDGVPVNEAGGTFNFGVVPLAGVDRLEFVRGPASTLYGSDAMTSVVQLWSTSGRTRTPEFLFGADGGNLGTAHGFASLAGAHGRLDYNFFADQFNTAGQGLNDDYSNSAQGGNLGVALAPRVFFRLRARHSNSRTGDQNEWVFGGQPLLPPDADQFARYNDFLASGRLDFSGPGRWQHHLTGFEYNQKRLNQDSVPDRTCGIPFFLDCPFSSRFQFNRAGLDYQGEYAPRSWARTLVGYQFEDENGSDLEDDAGFVAGFHGLRRNHALYVQQVLTGARWSLVAGVRFVHNESFGNKAVPRVAASLQVLRGGTVFSGTRLRFAFGLGIKEPRFEESFGIGGFGILPNPLLQPEENRSLEAGVEQEFGRGHASLSATYFNQSFRNLITFESFGPPTFTSQYVNLNQSLAHGAEVVFHAGPWRSLRLDAAYLYTSTQVLAAPLSLFDPLFAPGRPLLLRPRHAGSLLLTYLGKKWGADLGGSFVGRRPDSDFLFGAVPPVDHTAGYARFDLGGWYELDRYVTAYATINNVLDHHYEEVVGFPALGINFRAGLRLRLGGD